MYPGWTQFGQDNMLYRRSRSSDEELAETDLQDRLNKLEVSGQLLRNIVRLEEQLAQCRQFTPIFPAQSDRSLVSPI